MGANSVGSVRYAVVPGNAGTPADEADVKLTVSITDVRNKVGLADYTGEVEVTSSVRITDRLNGTAENQPATVQDTPFGVDGPVRGDRRRRRSAARAPSRPRSTQSCPA